jgi:hypothetical protein
MNTRFKFSRTITVAGFAADADPNVTPPLAANVWAIDDYAAARVPGQGHALVCAFNTSEPTGTLQFRTWFKEDSTSEWFILGEDTLTHRKRQVTLDLKSGTIFVQALALGNVGAAANVKLYAMEF